MSKSTIIEAQNSNTVFEDGKQSGILGKLKGIFADYKHGTRNSDRLYTEELWDNRVFGSEDVMEALQTKTLFGELDHPDGDRCETLAKNAAITITKLEKRPDEGVIYGEAEILDTPTGRIVKALADSGAKLGISSRGIGEEIFCEGQNIIDPDTYDFITFDVVVTPANTKARVELTESKKLDKLNESLIKEVNECETSNQLNQIKCVLENVNTTNKQNLLNVVETKLNKLNTKQSNVKLDEANKSLAIKVLKNKLQEANNTIVESLNASNKIAEENKNLVEQKDFYTQSRTLIKTKLKESTDKVVELEKQLTESKEELTKLHKEYKQQLSKELREHKEILLKVRQINDKKIENLEKQHKENTTQLNVQNTKLQESNRKLLETINKNRKIILESQKTNTQLNERIKMLEAKQMESNKKLTESKLNESKEIKSLKEQINKLQTQNSQLQEAQDRFSKLSFNPIGTVEAVAENFNEETYSQDEIDLFNALTNY